MTRLKLKEYAMINIEAFDTFLLKHEKRVICMFATFIHKTQQYHICFLDFSSLMFYLRTAKNLKFKDIDVSELTFKETDDWKAKA